MEVRGRIGFSTSEAKPPRDGRPRSWPTGKPWRFIKGGIKKKADGQESTRLLWPGGRLGGDSPGGGRRAPASVSGANGAGPGVAFPDGPKEPYNPFLDVALCPVFGYF